jgi:hypothetical protein
MSQPCASHRPRASIRREPADGGVQLHTMLESNYTGPYGRRFPMRLPIVAQVQTLDSSVPMVEVNIPK